MKSSTNINSITADIRVKNTWYSNVISFPVCSRQISVNLYCLRLEDWIVGAGEREVRRKRKKGQIG